MQHTEGVDVTETAEPVWGGRVQRQRGLN